VVLGQGRQHGALTAVRPGSAAKMIR
jgi:hypothetical protein